jgi:signal transduction histidine kinase
MKFFPDSPATETTFRTLMGVWMVLLIFALVIACTLLYRQKRYRLLGLAVPLLLAVYFAEQCFPMILWPGPASAAGIAVTKWLSTVPDWLLLLACVLFGGLTMYLMWDVGHFRLAHISAHSIKEAMDNLPSGICCYAEDGRIVLINFAMQNLCRKTTGQALISGTEFSERLRSGSLSEGARTVTLNGELIVILADGTAWKINNEPMMLERQPIHMMTASDITDAYRKTEHLQDMQSRLLELNGHLNRVNQQIVQLTAEQETLKAKARIHDELGSNLLSIRRFLGNGGSQEEKSALIERLRLGVTFLKAERAVAERDEYELMLETAERLGVKVTVSGTLPPKEPAKHVVATAIHECFTNTLRHAHGDALYLDVTENDTEVTVVFTNNGEQPDGPVHESGGLATLHALAGRAGGTMEIRTSPRFSLTLTLPKEVPYAI